MISRIEDGSITLPAIRRMMLTTSRNTSGLKFLAMSHAAMVCGMFSEVIRKENSTALVMMYKSIALMLAEASSTRGTSESLRSR